MMEPGKVIANKYRIESLIGTGGMSHVYKAQIMGTHKTVAIKALKEEFEKDAEFKRRFRREAQAVLTLSHENIVRSYDVCEENGSLYLVLEYVPGITLKEMIRRDGALPIRSAVNIACQLLDAIGHAHEAGIIHRDIKPQNVIVTNKGKAKLTDFGIARDAEATTVTFAGSNVVGSVHYISPEQARGEQATPESDLYSMGITLYEMLTGKLPFGGENTVTVALKHMQEEITPPIELRPEIPRALNDVIVKATAKNPQLRYHSAREMRQDIMRAMREPNGKFARIKELTKDNKQEKPKRRGLSGIVKIGITCLIAIGIFTTLVLTVRSLWERDKAAETELVPKLTGKTLEEAKQTAELRGYEVSVSAWVESDTVPSGQVVEQSPAAGASGSKGSTITVTISNGSMSLAVPNVEGMLLSEAKQTLQEAGLDVGNVEYREQAEAEVGTVISQSPAADTEMTEGDTVDLIISGEPDQTAEMPNLVGERLYNAVTVLNDRGFTKILVRPEEPVDDATENSVISQSPSSGMNADKRETVVLTVCNLLPGAYAAEIAFNVDVEENDTEVLVTMVLKEGVEYVLYEGELSKGTQVPVSFSAMWDEEGDRDVIVYLNNTEVRRLTASFQYRG